MKLPSFPLVPATALMRVREHDAAWPQRPLTGRRARFVDEFMVDLNGAAAAKRAGYSEHGAADYAKFLMRVPEVARAIEERMLAAEGAIRVDADRVLAELALIAFSDIRDYVRLVDGTLELVPSAELDPGAAAAIAFVAPAGKRSGARVRLHDKVRALRALMRHLGLHQERVHLDPQVQEAKALAIFARLFREAGIAPPPGFLLPPPPQDETP